MKAKIKETIKCVVWDLDNTIWDGVLLESEEVQLRPNIAEIIKELDSRGILHSIASKNNHDDVMKKLEEFELTEYFLYPEIHWDAKSTSLKNIQKNLNVGMDTILFIDDQQFELDEVKSVHPDVMCMNHTEYTKLLIHPRLQPRFITKDSKFRRQMYLEDIKRNQSEQSFQGPHESFLASLQMKFIISEAKEDDLRRAEELTIRTNQLNSTGITYDYDELNSFRKRDDYKLLVCELTDRYGSYGKIGLALVEITNTTWHVKLLLMSCRVMSRGVGSVLLSYIMQQAKEGGKQLLAEFRRTDRNRMMYATYCFANFKEYLSREDGFIIFEHDLSSIQPYPPFIEVQVLD
ncbi:HAD-IIIC family phosphatase [Brevibacillus laterosporus]|uniref:FkbH n=1 Tax=Brevibacillus laterosporus TaxID=1465 RepID=A0A0F7EJ64_BRELA|nr:HAD-IIIC family phosphatase [Brevibacillus laterosporus]AKF95955.1 FkbH [Brevibacillus laterosporus]